MSDQKKSENMEEVESKARYTGTMMVESILFMHGTPVTWARLEKICEITRHELQDIVESLRTSYEERSAGLRILVVEDRIQMVTHPDCAEVIEKFKRRDLTGELSNAALEVLAIVAYRGPLSKPDVEAVRGVNCAFTLRNLLLRGLVERVDHPRDQRTKLYRTTIDLVRSLGYQTIEELPYYNELVSDKRVDAVLYGEQSDSNEEE